MGVAMSEHRAQPAGRLPPQAALFTVFAALWAAGTLFHIASYNQWGQSRALVVAAALVLVWPRSVAALLLLALAQVVYAFRESPFIPNHYLFAALVNASILLAAAVRVLRRQSPLDAGALAGLFGPAVRVAVLILYGFVVFHKLNADFFDPATSCGAMFYDEQRSRMPWLPDASWMQMVSIGLALGLEAAIPLLLLPARTRHWGILVGASFHWLLGLNPIDRFYNFSALLLGLFALFASPALLARAVDGLGHGGWLTITRTTLALLAAAAVIGKYLPTLIGGADPFLALWAFYGLAATATWFVVCRNGMPSDTRASLRLTTPVLAVLPLAVVVNGVMPYLGLKTETSWAMFSNLRTEGGMSNHFLVPARLQPFDYQRDLVRIHRSSDRYLQSLATKGQLVPRFELQRRSDAEVTFSRDGEIVSGVIGRNLPGLPYLLRKLMMFRPVDADGRQRCHH
jgi:hypothetical protein